MNEKTLELPIDSLDNLTLEDLQEKLKLAKDGLDELAVRENNSEFYDKELKDSFLDAVERFSKNRELLKVYLESVGIDYDAAEENYNKYIDFRNNQFGLAKKEFSSISAVITGIEQAKREKNIQQTKNEEMEKFNKDKKELADVLYEMLNEIYKQIPQEAKEAGMDDEAALNKYLPQLTMSASTIEEYIRRIEETQAPFQLSAVKRDLEDRRLLKKI
jgi:hypothetical protein